MGRLGNAGNAPRTNHSTHPHPSGDDPWISHFCHPHPLELTSLEQALTPTICAGCASPAAGCVYSCKACNYVLDVSCAKMPRRIRHPAHPHSVNLFATPPSKDGPSNCDACGRSSSGFTFYCDPCGFRLHCQCAAKPLTINHRTHPHPLNLIFSPPYEDKGFSCDICGDAGLNHWLYRCAACEFDAHIGCATGGTLQPLARTPTTQQQAPARTPKPQQQAPARTPTPRQQQASPRPSAPLQQASPRPSTPQQQAARRPRTSQQQGPRLPTSQQQGFQRPFAPQQLAPPLSLLPPGLLQPLRPLLPGLLQPLRPLLPPGLLQPPRPLWTQPPQMNQATQGSNNSVEQQNGEGTGSREQQNGEGTKSEEHHNGEGTESVEHHNDEGDIPDTTGEEDGDVGGSSSGYHWNQDGCDDGSDWMMTQDGGYDESSSVPEDSFGGSDESYEVNMEVTFEL
ncbi:uncharacterized protein LOC135609120 [Musa acuminata AAA Group]|uniref:(wild Malaysian banana) hypothetical protein n=1 Tax=Musa acuminata subsp. malaccensis TaxID=214687 RepID=A0A804ISG1_MUSAM|nr:PREDICTED: atherin-like [Musa acuminata subsp. malaccensis]CAG1843003.1 unnamed protein product [Musa acuminata subsp. malaccensis]